MITKFDEKYLKMSLRQFSTKRFLNSQTLSSTSRRLPLNIPSYFKVLSLYLEQSLLHSFITQQFMESSSGGRQLKPMLWKETFVGVRLWNIYTPEIVLVVFLELKTEGNHEK